MPSMPTTFRPPGAPSRAEQRREADERRGKTAERGYGSRWQRAALGFRKKHPLCLGCQAIGIIEPATCVDHVEPHRGDRLKFWDRDNWQSSCDWHHNEIKQKLEAAWDRGELGLADLWLDSPVAIALSRKDI